MKLIFTKSNSPLSIFIRLITGEDCSHFAFVFQSPGRTGLMFESNLLGTHPAFFATALKTHTIVHEKDYALTVEQEDAIWDLVVESYDDKPYDFLGATYLGWFKLLHRILKVALPLRNKWCQPGQYFCDVVYDVFNKAGLSELPKIDVLNGMDTPHDVWLKVSEGTT